VARALLVVVVWMIGFWLISNFLDPWIGFVPPAGNPWFILRDLVLMIFGATLYKILEP